MLRSFCTPLAGRSKQITGKQFKSLADDAFTTTNAATAVFTKETDGLTRVKMAAVKVQSTDLVGESSDNYAYIVTGGARRQAAMSSIPSGPALRM